jgi:hypothetical protein
MPGDNCLKMLPVLLFCVLIQLGPTFKVRALPNIGPIEGFQSSFDESHHVKQHELANTLYSKRKTDEYLWRNEEMHRQPGSLTIKSDQHGKTKMSGNHGFLES